MRFGFQAVPHDARPTPDAARRLPTVRVRSFGATYSTVDEITWEAGTPVEEPRLTARFRVAVARGPLETLTLQLSPGYRIVSAEQSNEDAPLTVVGRRIELTRPVRAGESVEVVVRLVGGLAGGDAVEVTCRPDVQWLGCDPGDYLSAALPALPPTAEEGDRKSVV